MYEGHQTKNQKLSILAIEESLFHRIDIRYPNQLYKLKVNIPKPIYLSLNSLTVLLSLRNSQYLDAMLQMETVHSISVQASGFGVFRQEEQLKNICEVFESLASEKANFLEFVKKIRLDLPGWRAINQEFIIKAFSFVKKCRYLQDFSLNLSHAMDLRPSQESQPYKNSIYGFQIFKIDQFQVFLTELAFLPETLNMLQLRMSGWQGIDSSIVDILSHHLSILSFKIPYISILKLDLNGWGCTPNSIQRDSIEELFHCIEKFSSINEIFMDFRNWSENKSIKRFKEFFKHNLNNQGGDDSMLGLKSNIIGGSYMKSFFGSYLRSKNIQHINVVILN